MKPRLFTNILLVMLITVACGNGIIETPAMSTSKPEPIDPGFNLLVVAEGEVQLKRDGWSDYHPTTFGTVLHRGDQMQPESGANIIVLCDSMTTWTVPAGVPSGLTNGCPQVSEPPLVRGEGLIGSTRGGSDPLIPYIISPRKTRLMTDRPTLRWNTIPGASSYTVQVRGGDLQWETEVDEAKVVYPGEPLLEEGETYLLIITADNGSSSSDEGAVGLGFTLLTEAEAVSVNAASEQLRAFNLPSEAEDFALAQLYVGQGLVAEAIETLEALAKSGSQEAAVYRILGDLYRGIGLNRLGEERYLKAIELAEVTGDVEGEAAAQAGLGEVYVELGKTTGAINWLEQARDRFEALGDEGRVSEIENMLESLK